MATAPHVRKRIWTPAEAPPADARPFVHKLANDKLAYSAPGAGLKPNSIDEQRMGAAAVLTTPAVDRVGDVVHSAGCLLDQYRLNDVWDFGHFIDPMPVGRAHYKDGPLEMFPSKDMVWGWCFFDEGRPEGVQYFRLVKDGILTAVSIMFDPVAPAVRINHPDGKSGSEYKTWRLLSAAWCGVPCHPGAGRMDVVLQGRADLLRSYLERGEIEGARLSPLVKKSLEPLALPRKAHLFTGASTLQPSPAARHNAPRRIQEARPMTKAMSENSGTAGGYAADAVTKPDGETHDPSQIKTDIAAVMDKHKGDAHPDGPHDAYFHAESKAVHHQHHPEAHPLHLEAVGKDLGDVPGVESVRQAAATPEGEGWELVSGAPIHPDEERHPEPEPSREEGEQKAYWRKVAQVDSLLRSLPRKTYRLIVRDAKKALKRKDALAECVSAKIPKLREEGYPNDQSQAIAFSMCGEKKDLDADAVAGSEDDVGEEEKVPHGVEVCQGVIEFLEGEMDAMEPEVREMAEMAIEDIRSFAEARYPDHAFGGTEAKEEKPADSEEETETADDEQLADYTTTPPKPDGKRMKTWFRQFTELKRLRKSHHAVIKDATEHMGELAEMAPGETWRRSHATATKTHHAAMCKMCKELEQGPADEDEPGETPAKSVTAGAVTLPADIVGVVRSEVAEALRDDRYRRKGHYEDRPTATANGG